MRLGHLSVMILAVLAVSACHAKPVGESPAQHDHAHHDPHAPVGSVVKLSPAQWKEKLSPAQYRILREKGTERPGSGHLLREKRPGIFGCAGCGAPLFDAKTKFESGTGWPSFFQSLPGRVSLLPDNTYGMSRVEILCSRCGGHLGHVFEDGPRPTGKRYCVNSLSLDFTPAEEVGVAK